VRQIITNDWITTSDIGSILAGGNNFKNNRHNGLIIALNTIVTTSAKHNTMYTITATENCKFFKFEIAFFHCKPASEDYHSWKRTKMHVCDAIIHPEQ